MLKAWNDRKSSHQKWNTNKCLEMGKTNRIWQELEIKQPRRNCSACNHICEIQTCRAPRTESFWVPSGCWVPMWEMCGKSLGRDMFRCNLGETDILQWQWSGQFSSCRDLIPFLRAIELHLPSFSFISWHVYFKQSRLIIWLLHLILSMRF